MIKVPEQLLDTCRRQGLVIMAGAGLSASPPSSLPGWHPLNRAIFDATCDRVEEFLERPGYTSQIRPAIHARREADQFPPDYQAQILAESCGEVYFRALQALDVSTFNAAHIGIAQLAKHRLVKAVVTTNFDRLIEAALESAGVAHEVAYEPNGYRRCAQTLNDTPDDAPVQILKLHGCVQDHLSMIDTLKQRLLGRNDHLIQCVDKLLQAYLWLYVGFSAADLESDPGYLGLIAAADRSPGMVYVRWPGAPELNPGATALIDAYANKEHVLVAESHALFSSLAHALELPWAPPPDQDSDTKEVVAKSLSSWASRLSPANAIMCLAGVLEANGESKVAFEALHRLWNNRTSKLTQGDSNFDRFRLMHGRLGMGTGITSLVEDLDANRGLESIQNLLRVADKDPRAYAWAGLAWAWAGNLERALEILPGAEPVFTKETAPESKVDVWLALSEVLFLTADVERHIESWGSANAWAEQAGDLPRQARVVSFFLLMLSEFADNLFDSFFAEYASDILQRSARLHDPTIEGFHNLARGRIATRRRDATAGAEALSLAIEEFARAGRSPWCTYTRIEYTKVLMDQRRFGESADLLDQIGETIDRHQVLLPWYEEARGQHHRLLNREDIACSAFKAAADYAEKIGSPRRATVYRQYLDNAAPS